MIVSCLHQCEQNNFKVIIIVTCKEERPHPGSGLRHDHAPNDIITYEERFDILPVDVDTILEEEKNEWL